MARTKQTKEKKEKDAPIHRKCSECRLSIRDIEGPSFNIDTGEYFMGSCTVGNTDGAIKEQPDGTVYGKVFMDKPRICKQFQ